MRRPPPSPGVASSSPGDARPPRDASGPHPPPRAEVELELVPTLFALPVPESDDLLDLLAPEVARLLGLRSIAYRVLRARARRVVSLRSEADSEEVRPYDAELEALAVELELDEASRASLRALELDAYRTLLAPRPSGRSLYEAARKAGSRLVLRVASHVPPALVPELLEAHGLAFAAIRWSGPRSRRAVPCPAASTPFDRFRETPLYARLFAADAASHSPSTRALLATMAVLHDANEERFPPGSSLFGGDAFRLGHDAFGPLLLGFAKWTLEAAKRRGYERLLFLARDGKIVQRAYELVARGDADAPTGIYVLCSRRATHVAGLLGARDVVERVFSTLGDVTIGGILERRLGLGAEAVDVAIWKRHGFSPTTSFEEAVGREAAFVAFLHDVVPLVLANAAREREAYLAYLGTLGLGTLRSSAVVDVGYSGTMQAALDGLFGGGTGLGGLYLATYHSIVANVERHGLPSAAYAGERIDPTDTDHPIVRFAYLFETFFSGLDTSFVKMERRPDGSLVPIFVEPHPDEARRLALVSEIQRGALDFVEAFTARWGRRLRDLDLEPAKTMRVASRFFAQPDPDDARHFQGVPHEDAFGAHGVHAILPPDHRLAVDRSVWEPGRKALLEARSRERAAAAHARHPRIVRESMRVGSRLLLRGVALAGSPFLSKAKLEKLHRDPMGFFSDARSPLLRSVARALAGSDGDERA